VTFKDGIITLTESLIYVVIYTIYIILLSQWSKFVPYTTDHTIEYINEDFIQEEEIIEKKSGVVGKIMHWIDMMFDKIFPNLEKKP
jgi:hypothetical protein